jgi:hypothetical protein
MNFRVVNEKAKGLKGWRLFYMGRGTDVGRLHLHLKGFIVYKLKT